MSETFANVFLLLYESMSGLHALAVHPIRWFMGPIDGLDFWCQVAALAAEGYEFHGVVILMIAHG